jgi:hypothetical protein
MALFTAKLDVGQEHYAVAYSAAGTSTTGVSLIVDKAKVTTQEQLLNVLEELRKSIQASNYPPA